VETIVVHPLTTGHVRIHVDMVRGKGSGLRRRARILRKGALTEERPIHAWLVGGSEGWVLVDAGETHEARDAVFAEFRVGREDELDHALRGVGVEPGEVGTVVLTHVHGDHVDGLVHVPGAKVVAGAEEVKIAASLASRATRRFTKQPLPPSFAPRSLALDGPAFGAFPRSKALTTDGRVVAVPTPGHTLGHLSVIVVQPDHHVFLGGDSAYDQQQLVDLQVDGVSPKDDVARDTMARILEHARTNPTVYLPSHDVDAVQRLRTGSTLPR
jgi:glyoxylase-like metal-dependent hydrolase (beta-lactamase superfamily II)